MSLYVTPGAVPYVVRPGVDAVLRHTVLLRSTEAAPGSVTLVTAQPRDAAGDPIGPALTATLDGAGPAYVVTLPGATTAGQAVTDSGSVLWSYTIGGVVYQFRRLLRIVLVEVTPTVISTELAAEYPDLMASLRASAADLRADLAEAWEDIERDLFEHGVDIHRVYDPRHLARPHLVKAASIRYAKAGGSTRDEGMVDRARELADEYAELMERSGLYDLDSDGVADSKRRMTTDAHWSTMRRGG